VALTQVSILEQGQTYVLSPQVSKCDGLAWAVWRSCLGGLSAGWSCTMEI